MIWVLGTKPNGDLATLLRIDPSSGRVQHRLQLAEQPSCATEKFASCYPVAATDGVWVPLLDEIVHVNRSGTMADQTVQVNGHVWDLTGSLGQLWALAETAIYRITESTGLSQRIGLKKKRGRGRAIEPRHRRRPLGVGLELPARHHHEARPPDPDQPRAEAPQVTVSRIYPGAGALALVDGGLWVSRFDGQGELDRLNAATGALTGPFLVVPNDPTVLVERGGGLWVLSYVSSGNVRTVTKVTLTPAAAAK